MRKDDWSVPALLLESVTFILGIIYIGLQIYYGVHYHVPPFQLIMNLLLAVLLYVALTLLTVYPERIYGPTGEASGGKIRKYTIRMVRLVKFIFIASLPIPCISDVIGINRRSPASLVVIGLILIVVAYYGYRIIQILRKRK